MNLEARQFMPKESLSSLLKMWFWALVWGVLVGSYEPLAGFFAFTASLLWQECSKYEKKILEIHTETPFMRNLKEVRQSHEKTD